MVKSLSGTGAFGRALVVLVPVVILQCGPASSSAQTSNASAQIAAAVRAAPTEYREGAMVYGYADDGSFVTLREGTNDMICLADDPAREGWSVACYHRAMEPFMAMGRALRAEGITEAGEVNRRRWEAADAGTLSMPEEPSTLYVLTGTSYDSVNDEVDSPYLRWVIYTPYATTESTGLASIPEAPGQPWLMFPGTAGAHIMISPPQSED